MGLWVLVALIKASVSRESLFFASSRAEREKSKWQTFLLKGDIHKKVFGIAGFVYGVQWKFF